MNNNVNFCIHLNRNVSLPWHSPHSYVLLNLLCKLSKPHFQIRI